MCYGDLTVLNRIEGPGLAGARALASCAGQYLCVARAGLAGLAVVDVTDPATAEPKAWAWTAGLGWDLAVIGTRAYLAHGWLGLGVYDITNPLDPRWVDQVWPCGRVVALASLGQLLAVGTAQGDVILYAWLRFEGGKLWVAGKHWNWAQVCDVSDQAAPSKVADLSGESVQWARRWWLGRYVVGFHGRRVQLEQVEAR